MNPSFRITGSHFGETVFFPLKHFVMLCRDVFVHKEHAQYFQRLQKKIRRFGVPTENRSGINALQSSII